MQNVVMCGERTNLCLSGARRSPNLGPYFNLELIIKMNGLSIIINVLMITFKIKT
jgi:hypothetical protein